MVFATHITESIDVITGHLIGNTAKSSDKNSQTKSLLLYLLGVFFLLLIGPFLFIFHISLLVIHFVSLISPDSERPFEESTAEASADVCGCGCFTIELVPLFPFPCTSSH